MHEKLSSRSCARRPHAAFLSCSMNPHILFKTKDPVFSQQSAVPPTPDLPCSSLHSCRGWEHTHLLPAHSWRLYTQVGRNMCSSPGPCWCRWLHSCMAYGEYSSSGLPGWRQEERGQEAQGQIQEGSMFPVGIGLL